MGSQLDPLPLSRVGSQEGASKSQLPQLDFVKPLSGFHPVTWERVTNLLLDGSKVPMKQLRTHKMNFKQTQNEAKLKPKPYSKKQEK